MKNVNAFLVIFICIWFHLELLCAATPSFFKFTSVLHATTSVTPGVAAISFF